MPNLSEEMERVGRKQRAAKAIVKWLADLPHEDAVQVLQHVGIDLHLTVTPNGTTAPATPPKAA